MSKIQLVSADEEFDYQIGDSVLTLRRIPADETTRMLRRHTKKRPGGQDEVDSLTFNREYRDRAIRSWRGVEDRHGADVPCTAETKMLLPDDAWREIQQAIGAANIDDLMAREDGRKNLNSGSEPAKPIQG